MTIQQTKMWVVIFEQALTQLQMKEVSFRFDYYKYAQKYWPNCIQTRHSLAQVLLTWLDI